MQSPGTLPQLSFGKDPRPGQATVFEAVVKAGRQLNVKLPTGYGKTFTACGCYSLLKRLGRVNRLLYIVPTTKQFDQFESDGPNDLADACVEGPRQVVDISFFSANAIKKHRMDTAQVFATTIQSVITNGGMDRISDLLQTGRWMIVIDEYHHYGVDAAWGRSILQLNHEFLLAMSATPDRADDDSAFGEPDVTVTYRAAVDQKAAKPLVGHSYVYRIDAIMKNGDVKSYTTSELADEMGVLEGESEKLEKRRIQRQMRWSPKYVSPLVSIPIERMQRESLVTGYRLQAIIGAMCVSHAQLICEQVGSMYPELAVDWVGTGTDGRDPKTNLEVLNKFCPKKDERGQRNHTLDVLVHVGMAGEGMDSTNVSEVIHLNPASVNNTNNQENGRASRYLEGVIGNINFDSCSQYAKQGYIGDAIMDAMDALPPRPEGDCIICGQDPCACDRSPSDDLLPEEPTIQIQNMEVIKIDSGQVKLMARIIARDPHFPTYSERDLDDPDSTLPQFALDVYRKMRALEAQQHDEKSVILQWNESVNKAATIVTGRIIKEMVGGARPEKSLAGDIKKRINGKKKAALGGITADVEVCRRHYQWLKALEGEIINNGIPAWLL